MAGRSLSENYFDRLSTVIAALPFAQIEAVGESLYQAYLDDKQLFVMGNGGSAAAAAHFANDVSKSLTAPGGRRLRATCLNNNLVALTALANDLGYKSVFAEQMQSSLHPEDIVIAMSVSGNSPNIVEALTYARSRSAVTIGFLGMDGGIAKDLVDISVHVESYDYGLAEDIYTALGHCLQNHLAHRAREDAQKNRSRLESASNLSAYDSARVVSESDSF